MLYIIAYEKEKIDNYSLLDKYIKQNFKWWNHIENVYIIETELTSDEILHNIQNFINLNNNLIIAEITNNIQGIMDNNDSWNWIKEKI